MGARGSIGLAFLVLAAACAPRGGVQSPEPELMSREKGPNGWIAANYYGGLVSRTLNISFELDQAGFVLVGHLGGDGVIRVVYPYSAPSYGNLPSPVPPHRTFSLESFYAQYDGAPEMYSFRMSPLRSTGAKLASYDGAGHGYVFLLASRAPLRYEIIQDGFEWLDVPVRNYDNTTDPRRAIEQYAQALTYGERYTLKFASIYSSQGFVSSAALAADCAALSALGLGRLHNFWQPAWGGFVDGWSLEYQTRMAFGRFTCGFPHYASISNYASYGSWQRQRGRGYGWPLTPTVPTATEPEPNSPVKNRPTFRPFGERAPHVGQSAINRSPATRQPGFGRPTTVGSTDNTTRYVPRTFNPARNPSSHDVGGGFTRGSGGATGGRVSGDGVSRGSVDRSPPSRSPSPAASSPARTSTPSSTTSTTSTTKTKQ